MIEYRNSEGLFSVSYSDLQQEFVRYREMSDEMFKDNLAGAIHFAVFVCWFKELQTQHTCADDGIIHQLVHLLHIGDDMCMHGKLPGIRKLFNEQLELV